MPGCKAAQKRPLVVVGGSVWDGEDAHALRDFAETAGVPVACVFRRQHLFDHEHPHYAGDIGIGVNPALRRAVEETDLLVLLGTRFSEIPSQSYALPLAAHGGGACASRRVGTAAGAPGRTGG